MANGYDDNLRGALFKNKAKRPDKQDADYRGNCEVNGVAYWIDAWINEPKNGGDKYMSLRFKPKEVQAEPPKQETAPLEDFDDALPF